VEDPEDGFLSDPDPEDDEDEESEDEELDAEDESVDFDPESFFESPPLLVALERRESVA
jgi:hypothetical protein